MQHITLRVISGADRGQIFRELPTPITIGREEGNAVQLNDERISRYHVKIQEDNGRLVVTDLESTNGTRINGHVCNLKILRYGDTISVGRTVLLVGSREQIVDLLGTPAGKADAGSSDYDGSSSFDPSTGLAIPRSANVADRNVTLPQGMSPGQAAELRELLDHFHNSMRTILDNASVSEKENCAVVDIRAWQNLLMTQSEIAELIRAIEDPQASSHPEFDTGQE